MRRIFALAFLAASLMAPAPVLAHGIVQDGHPLRPIDYIELIGIGVASLGMIIYSLDQWRKDRKNRCK
jgi:hypothetical protein